MFRSFSGKMIFASVLVVIVSLGALSSANIYISKKYAEETALMNLQKSVENYATTIGSFFYEREAELTVLADSAEIATGDSAVIVPYMDKFAKSHGKDFEMLLYSDDKGNGLTNTGVKYSTIDRDYYKEVMKTGKPYISTLITSKVTGNVVLTIVMPIKKGDKTVALVGGVVQANNLDAKADKMKFGTTGYAYMIQNDGFVITHPKKDMILKFNAYTEDSTKGTLRDTLQKAFVDSGIITAEYNFMGLDKFSAAQQVKDTPFVIVITDDKTDVYKGVTAQRNITIVITLLAIAIAASVIFFVVRELAVKKIGSLVEVAGVLEKGDYSKKIPGFLLNGSDEFGKLARAFDNMKASVSVILHEIVETSKDVNYTANEFTEIAGQAAAASESVAHTVVNVTSSMDRASTMVNDTGDAVAKMTELLTLSSSDSEELAVLAQRASESSNVGAKVIGRAMEQMHIVNDETVKVEDAMRKLVDSSQKIGEMVTVISDIAGQTNLLALNAAIEAARAGEQGRGFAVVAEEVRKLAEQSQAATSHIVGIISGIDDDMKNAVSAVDNSSRSVEAGYKNVEQAGSEFVEISNVINSVSEKAQRVYQASRDISNNNENIAKATKELMDAIAETNDEMQNVSAVSEEQSASMQHIADTSRNLAVLSNNLSHATDKFTI